MLLVQNVCEIMEQLASVDLALEWDNVGLQIGNPQREVSTVLVTLTLTEKVIEKAVAANVDLIITHHPLIFQPVQTIRQNHPIGSLIWGLIQNDLALYVSHTNLDQAPLGLNHWLAQDLQLHDARVLVPGPLETAGLGRIGQVAPKTLRELAQEVETLWGHSVRLVGDPSREVSTIAVLGGSGGKFIAEAKNAGADVLITGDVSYHQAMDALAMGLTLLDAGHFGTEWIMVPRVATYLRKRLEPHVLVIEEASSNPFGF